ncbi:MAG: hypothetical protein SFV51_09495 [Bryobacteraceae bacterium]|nr:hypothetical protein [Bryobacteraceae bacterium]
MAPTQDDRAVLRREIERRQMAADKAARRYRRLNIALLALSLVSGLLAAALAGDSAATGKLVAAPVAQASTGNPPSPLPKGWRNVCGLIAVLSLVGTAASGFSSVFKIAEHQSKAFVCAGTLDSLQTDLLPGAAAGPETIAKVRADLAKLVKDYPEYLR